jgi:hypothetical protein
MAEMAFCAYDPCFCLATHTLPGKTPLNKDLYNKGDIIQTVGND